MKDSFLKLFNVEPLTQKEFDSFSDLFRQISGIHIKADKKGLVDSRLRKRFISLQMGPTEYFNLLQKDKDELDQFISALTTHKTDWFREPIHFRILEDYLTHLRQKPSGKKNSGSSSWSGGIAPASPRSSFNCWSAACSTGEEVYSLAMILDRLGPEYKNWSLLGSDISHHCVVQAQEAIYDRHTVDRQVPPECIKRYFLRNADAKYKDLYRFTPEFDDKIKFIEFNLTQSKLPSGMQFDVILLRNVLIYFEKDVSAKIIRNLLTYLKPGGLLIMGLAESLSHPQEFQLKRLESSVYLK